MKKFFGSKWAKRALLFCLVVSMMVCTAFAEETGTSSSSVIVSAFTTGFQSMVADTLSMIAAMAPPAISIAGVIFLAKKAMGWFKGMAK